ncbi:MAG: M3 family metallopeptidase, partial [Thermoplasmata archaeon]
MASEEEQVASMTTPKLLFATSPEEVTARAEECLARASQILEGILATEGPRTVANTLAPFNDLLLEVTEVSNQGDVLSNLHPDSTIRDAGEKAHQAAKNFETELSLNRPLYEAFAALDVDGEDAETRYAVFKILRDFRRAGVDRDEATRSKIRKLQDEIVAIGQEFERNIREDVRSVQLRQAEELKGLPEDYIASHPPGEDGLITITTDYPDIFPVLKYARDADLRRRLLREFHNRGHPINLEILDRLLAKRYELAQILGHESFAGFITEDKMIGSAEAATEFVDRITEAAERRAREDYAALLEEKRQDDPDAEGLDPWDSFYYSEKVRVERYGFDSKQVRSYFQVEKVLEGILSITSELFGVRYERVTDVPVWHDSVVTYDVFEGDERIGRFYLDLHPREGKFTHAASATVLRGVRGIQLPQGLLMCNFPDPRKATGPALMEHGDVVTFFHEFGHLLHSIFSGSVKWAKNSLSHMEWDFIEVPSQLLEEWARDPEVLQSFAIHHETGEPIPAELVERMEGAQAVGRGLNVRRQMFYAALSLSYYDNDPKGIDSTALAKELQRKYDFLPWFEGTHFQCSFGHLNDYSAIYYTYMWSLVIEKDMFGLFKERGSLL